MIIQKRNLLITLFLLLISTTFTNCGKEEMPDESFEWNFDSTQLKAVLSLSAEKRYDISSTIPTVYINGYASAGNDLQISLYPASGTGTFVAGGTGQTMNSVYAHFNGEVYRIHNGIPTVTTDIIITDLNSERIKGNFNGSLESLNGDTIQISGSFDVRLQ